MKKALPARGQRTTTNKAKTVSAASPSLGLSAAQEKKYQAHDDLRTIQRAAEIKADSSRMRAAQAEAKQQMKALQSVTKK